MADGATEMGMVEQFPAGWLEEEFEAAKRDVEGCALLRRWSRGEYHGRQEADR